MITCARGARLYPVPDLQTEGVARGGLIGPICAAEPATKARQRPVRGESPCTARHPSVKSTSPAFRHSRSPADATVTRAAGPSGRAARTRPDAARRYRSRNRPHLRRPSHRPDAVIERRIKTEWSAPGGHARDRGTDREVKRQENSSTGCRRVFAKYVYQTGFCALLQWPKFSFSVDNAVLHGKLA